MGLNRSRASLSDALFSGVQQRVLGLLFGQPGRSFHGNELMRLSASGKGGLQRELQRLTDSGLVTVSPVANQKRYQANPDSPLFEEICAIVHKTFGVADVLRDALAPLEKRIALAFVFGSVAKRTDTSASDIDMLVVSDSVSYQDVFRALGDSESKLGRTLSPTLYTTAEFARRRSEGNSFVLRVLEQPKIFLIGGEHDLEEPGKPRKDRQAQARAAGAGGIGRTASLGKHAPQRRA